MLTTVGVGKGESIDNLTGRLTACFDIGDNDAKRIARTETHGAAEDVSHTSATAISNAGFTVLKSWLATADTRTRDSHIQAEVDNEDVPINEPFSVGDTTVMFPGDPDCDDPGEVINCFPGSTHVEFTSVRSAMRRWYQVPLFHLVLLSGNELTGTPNHPILTRSGWRALKD